MPIRATVVTLSFALLLTLFWVYLQNATFEVSDLGWAVIFSLPLGMSVLWGALGTTRLEYPSPSFVVLAFWIVSMSSTLVGNSTDPRFGILFSEQAVTIGHWLFVLWCFVFVLVAGKPVRTEARLQPRGLDVFALSVPIALALGYQLLLGRFTNYQAIDATQPNDTRLVVAMGLGKNALVCLPGFFLLVGRRAKSASLMWYSVGAAALSVVLLLLTGGRGGIALAAAITLFFARASGIRLKLGRTTVVAFAVPISFVLVFTYRAALSDSERAEMSLSDLTSVASTTATELAAREDTRNRAVTNFSENIRVRMEIAPQFFAVVDMWLAHGAAFGGSFNDGLIRVLPSYFFADKNELAEVYNFEFMLQRSGQLPEIDLSPTPWMQWLFELGWVGIVLGATFYGLLVRLVERGLLYSKSSYAVLFWTCMLAACYTADNTTDTLALVARDAITMIGAGYMLSLGMRAVAFRGVSVWAPARVAAAEPRTPT